VFPHRSGPPLFSKVAADLGRRPATTIRPADPDGQRACGQLVRPHARPGTSRCARLGVGHHVWPPLAPRRRVGSRAGDPSPRARAGRSTASTGWDGALRVACGDPTALLPTDRSGLGERLEVDAAGQRPGPRATAHLSGPGECNRPDDQRRQRHDLVVNVHDLV